MNFSVVLAKMTVFANAGSKFFNSVTSLSKSIGSSVNSAKLLLTEIMGATGTLVGIGSITGWQYAAIIGGVAVVLAVERQPSQTEKSIAAKANLLKAALQARKGTGKFDVMIDDVLKVL